jgi:hypothetical protein
MGPRLFDWEAAPSDISEVWPWPRLRWASERPETVWETWETKTILMGELVDHQVFKMIIY